MKIARGPVLIAGQMYHGYLVGALTCVEWARRSSIWDGGNWSSPSLRLERPALFVIDNNPERRIGCKTGFAELWAAAAFDVPALPPNRTSRELTGFN